jgi:hypothetical protein
MADGIQMYGIQTYAFLDCLLPLEPSHCAEEAAGTITVAGQNFLPGVQVSIGGTPATEVQRLDEHTLLVGLPAGLAPDIYDIWVTNTGGQAGVAQRALRLGRWVFLPLAVR